jgi:hypothetical protein
LNQEKEWLSGKDTDGVSDVSPKELYMYREDKISFLRSKF